MSNPSARHQLVCAIVHRYPKSAVALAAATGVPLPEHDDVMATPDSHPMQDGDPVYTDATVRLLRDGKPVYFLTVEMQRRWVKGKHATLHAYHGSGVDCIDAGGHVFLLSDKASVAERFRQEEADRRAELAFSGTCHSAVDLKQLTDPGQPLPVRALPAALERDRDLRANLPDAVALLRELRDSDATLANLYLRTMIEEVPMTMLGEVLQQDMFEKLRELESFRQYEAKFQAEITAKVVAEAEAKAEKARVEAEAERARVEAEAKAATMAEALAEFLVLRGDAPTEHALNTISTSRNSAILGAWLKRAFLGETSAQLFPEPPPQTT